MCIPSFEPPTTGKSNTIHYREAGVFALAKNVKMQRRMLVDPNLDPEALRLIYEEHHAAGNDGGLSGNFGNLY